MKTIRCLQKDDFYICVTSMFVLYGKTGRKLPGLPWSSTFNFSSLSDFFFFFTSSQKQALTCVIFLSVHVQNDKASSLAPFILGLSLQTWSTDLYANKQNCEKPELWFFLITSLCSTIWVTIIARTVHQLLFSPVITSTICSWLVFPFFSPFGRMVFSFLLKFIIIFFHVAQHVRS